MTRRSTGRDSDQVLLRLPEGMKSRILREAKLNGRSMNAEIVSALAEAYPDENNPTLMQLAQDELLRLEQEQPGEERNARIEALKRLQEVMDR